MKVKIVLEYDDSIKDDERVNKYTVFSKHLIDTGFGSSLRDAFDNAYVIFDGIRRNANSKNKRLEKIRQADRKRSAKNSFEET